MTAEIRVCAAALLAVAIAACGEDPTGTEELAPRRELAAVNTAPSTLPAGTRVRCYTGADGVGIATECPVLRWRDVTYWVLEYEDGRTSLNLVAYDEDDAIITASERTGTHRLYDISVNSNTQTVTLFGQNAQTAVVPWSVLEAAQSGQ